MFRFSSTITKCTPDPWFSPMKECGTRCRKTSDRRPPVCRVMAGFQGNLKIDNATYCKRSHGVEGIPIDFSRDKSKDEVGNAACTISQVDDSNRNHALHSRTDVKRSKDRVPGRPKREEPGEDLAHNRRLLVLNGVFERAKLFHRRAILYVSFLNTRGRIRQRSD